MKLPSYVLPVSLAAVVGIGGFVAGRNSATATKDSATTPSTKSERGTTAGTRGGTALSGESGASSRSNGRRESLAKLDKDQIQDRMRQLIQGADAQDRTRAWLDFIDGLQPGQFEQVVTDFRAMGMTEERMTEYAMLLSAWAKNDPIAALDFAEKNTGNAFARQTILSTWAASDLEGALSWAKSHFEGGPDQANPWMVGVIRGIASTDPVRATQLMQEMPRSNERGQALSALIPTLLAQGPEAAKAWAEGITDESLRDGALRELAPRLAEKDPRTAAEWLAKTNSPSANRTIDDVMSTWMKSNQTEAIAHYESIPSGELRTNALRGVVNSLAFSDPQQAATFLNNHRGDADDGVYQQFVWHAVGNQPELAVNQIANIQDERNRERTYGRVLGMWMQRDPNAAQKWMSTANLPANVVQRLQQQQQGTIRR